MTTFYRTAAIEVERPIASSRHTGSFGHVNILLGMGSDETLESRDGHPLLASYQEENHWAFDFPYTGRWRVHGRYALLEQSSWREASDGEPAKAVSYAWNLVMKTWQYGAEIGPADAMEIAKALRTLQSRMTKAEEAEGYPTSFPEMAARFLRAAKVERAALGFRQFREGTLTRPTRPDGAPVVATTLSQARELIEREWRTNLATHYKLADETPPDELLAA